VAQGVAEGATMWQPSLSCPTEGFYYPPTLFTNVSPASTIAQVEIFGPVLVAMTFRNSTEAVELANNTAYGLAASVWSENVNLALDVARRIKAGTVWVNCTNLLDAASGFGGYRESGFGREGGKEGLYDYVKRVGADARPPAASAPVGDELEAAASEAGDSRAGADDAVSSVDFPPLDRTPKMYIGGKQSRPDSGYSIRVLDPAGVLVGEVGEGSRKDIRNAVEAAQKAAGWSGTTGYNRSQILYYLAENLSERSDEFARRIAAMTGCPLRGEDARAGNQAARTSAQAEVSLAIERLFTYGAWADKYDGRVAHTPLRGLTIAVPEPIGVIGILCPDAYPLLGFVSLVASAIAVGNTVVVVPSQPHPLSATDFYQVLETSDVPAGVVNVVTGKRDPLAAVLAAHDDVQSVWYFGTTDGVKAVELASAGNLKRTWAMPGSAVDWAAGGGDEYLREATQVKNIWVPHGD